MLEPKLVTPSTIEVISLADLKDDLMILSDDFDLLLPRLRARAIAYLDGYSGILGQAITTQTWEQSFPSFAHKFELPVGPIQSLDEIRYYDENNVEQTFDASEYLFYQNSRCPYIKRLHYSTVSIPGVYPRDDAVTVRWTAGMASSTETVDDRIVCAVSKLVGHFKENPDATSIKRSHPVAIGVDDIIAPLRKNLI